MNGIFEKPVSPSDCILAIAIPLTKDEFLADLNPEAPKDYAKYYRSLVWGKPNQEELWVKYRESISNLIEGVAVEVERLGVKVIRKVKVADLPLLLNDRIVISLVSHWRGAYIEPDDFADFPRFVDKLKFSSDEVSTLIRQKLSSKTAALLWQFEATDVSSSILKKELSKELNSLLETENLGRRPGFDNSTTEQLLPVEQRAYLNRATLDVAFGDELKKGNRMEFFDGLQSAEVIREMIPESFSGLLDLIVCNSVLPAEIIKLIKRNCLIISNQFPAQPSFRLLLYKAIIQSLKIKPNSFVNAMMEVRQGLGNYLQRL